MPRLWFSRTFSNASLSGAPSPAIATDAGCRGAEVISLDAARAVFRPQLSAYRMMQAEIVEYPREPASGEFFVFQDEPLLRFRDFSPEV